MTYQYLVQYLNESGDTSPSAALETAINAIGAKGFRLLYKPERLPVNDANNNQKSDNDGNLIYAWECWFEKVSS